MHFAKSVVFLIHVYNPEFGLIRFIKSIFAVHLYPFVSIISKT